MITSCIQHPPKEPLIVIHKWQIEFCEDNACAAALLSFFEYWHNNKLDMRSRIPEEDQTDDDLWQWHTNENIAEGILLYARSAISKAIQLLESKGVIESRNNPDPRYSFDRTKQYLFKPEIVKEWLKTRKPFISASAKKKQSNVQKQSMERSKTDNASAKKKQAIPETTKPEISPEIRSRIQVNQDKGIVEASTGDKSNQGSKPSEQEKPPSPPKPTPAPVPLPESRGTSVRSGKEQIDLDADQLQIVKDLFDWTCDLLSPGEPHQKDWPDIAWLVSRGMGFSEGKALYQELIDSGLALAHWGMVRGKFGLERARSKRADPIPARAPSEPASSEPVDTSQALALIEVIDQVQYENRSKRLSSSKLEELVREVCSQKQIAFDAGIFLEFGRGRK